MTPYQEEALFNFLENENEPFTLDSVLEYIRIMDTSIRTSDLSANLPMEIAAIIDSHHVAFRLNSTQWVSRRGCFENIPFVISPTKLELLNGILIPGHRCVPFANPARMPHEFRFFWKNKEIPITTSEGPPEDFYPYYYIYGEEYAPQYVARDNPENESAFNDDPFDDPPEVSINTIDMRNIFREAAFVPGDRFIARSRDWKLGHFDLEKVQKGKWSESDLFTWFEAAEAGFEESFTLLGPGLSTEEQIAYAYWYGGKRMRELPAYSLEEFLSEKTDRIENMAYGIETRFWFAGKEIPDSKGLAGFAVPPDRTFIEDILCNAKIPVSEYVILSYVRDALFRNEQSIDKVLNRIITPSISISGKDRSVLARYIDEARKEIQKNYSRFLDQRMGQIRQQAAELHTAVIDLAAQLQKSGIDPSWLPRHIFIMLSQIQSHAARLLEDLDLDESPPKSETEAMDFSLDSMVETFRDIKEMITEAMNNFRRKNLLLIRPGKDEIAESWRAVQISIAGIDVWRRIQLPLDRRLEDLHQIIQTGFDWKDNYPHRFYAGGFTSGIDRKTLDDTMKIKEVCNQGINEMNYEYGTKWNVTVIILSPFQPGADEKIRCVAGEGASPPENISGPLRYRKILSALSGGSEIEKLTALHDIGQDDFNPKLFDLEKTNKKLHSLFLDE